MVSGLSRLRVLSVLLPLVLVAAPLGGRLSDRPAAPAASRQPSATTNNLEGVVCPRPSTCVAVGDNGTILRSTDGGRTWRRQTSSTPNNLWGPCPPHSICVRWGVPNLLGVACPSPSACVAVGEFGTNVRSTDGGRTWRRQLSGWRSQPSVTTDDLDGVACPRPSTCVAVGEFGTIVRSTDGGSTWRSV